MKKDAFKVLVTKEQIELSEFINLKVNYWSDKIKSDKFPKHPNGLVFEKVRFGAEYKEVERQFKFWFERLREFNGTLSNKQKKELSTILKEERLKNK